MDILEGLGCNLGLVERRILEAGHILAEDNLHIWPYQSQISAGEVELTPAEDIEVDCNNLDSPC